jgi:hypothetical protein
LARARDLLGHRRIAAGNADAFQANFLFGCVEDRFNLNRVLHLGIESVGNCLGMMRVAINQLSELPRVELIEKRRRFVAIAMLNQLTVDVDSKFCALSGRWSFGSKLPCYFRLRIPTKSPPTKPILLDGMARLIHSFCRELQTPSSTMGVECSRNVVFVNSGMAVFSDKLTSHR